MKWHRAQTASHRALGAACNAKQKWNKVLLTGLFVVIGCSIQYMVAPPEASAFLKGIVDPIIEPVNNLQPSSASDEHCGRGISAPQ